MTCERCGLEGTQDTGARDACDDAQAFWHFECWTAMTEEYVVARDNLERLARKEYVQ